MELGVAEIVAGLGGTTVIGGAINKYVLPMIKSIIKNKSEENKLKIKMQSGDKSEIANIWKQQYDEVKEDLKLANDELKSVNEVRYSLEVKVATLKERLNRYAREHGVVLSVKPKDKDTK